MKINWRGFFAALLAVAIVNSVLEFLNRGFFSWIYEIEPATIWKDFMLTPDWFIWIVMISLLLSLLFVIGFVILWEGLPGRDIGKGLDYGWIVWVIATVPNVFSQLVFMNIATGYLIYALVFGLAKSLISGAIIAAVYKPPKKSPITGTVDRAVSRVRRKRV